MIRDMGEISHNRLNLIGAIIVIITIVFCFRLFQKQVIEYDQYKAKADRQHTARQQVTAQRGTIFTNEQYSEPYPMAANTMYYQVLVVPRSVKEPEKLSRLLGEKLGIDSKEIFKKINNKKWYIPPLKRRLNKQEAEVISRLKLVGVYVMPEAARFYSEGPMLAHVLGYVDAEGKGNYGLEAFYEEAMQGINGVRVSTRDSRGKKISTVKTEVGAQDGADIYLNIEHNAQFKAEELLAKAMLDHTADKASMVVVDIKTGAVTVMASNPSYDPNSYSKVPSFEVFRNPVISETWEPGSIMKPLIVGAGLDLDVIDPETAGDFTNCVTVQNYPICTAEKKAFGHETIGQILQNSDNVGMVWIADKIGNEQLYKYMDSYGLGKKTLVDLQGEAAGNLRDVSKWRDITRSTLSFGQGVSTTPMQMVMAFAAVANKGVLLKPHVVKAIVKADGTRQEIKKEEAGRIFKEETARDLTQMLIDVVEKGTGRRAKINGYWVAGKTGTAQVPKPEGGYYEDRHIGSFAGFFPADNPRFAMVVKIDNPKNTEWAESSAGPVFNQMAQWLLNYYRIAPNRNS